MFRLLLVLLAGLALLQPGSAYAQGTAFSCDGTFYQIRQVGNTSQIFKVDRSSAAYTTTAYNIQNGSNDLGVLVNGLAYNPQDGYMYALSTPGSGGSNSYNTIKLYKIGQSGIVQVGSANVTTDGTTALNLVVASGTFDKSGNYYFTSQNTATGNGTAAANYNVYRLQPTSSTPTVATQLTTTNSGNYTFYDIAYNPSDNNLYGTLNTGSLYKIVLSGGSSTAPTAATVTQITASNANGASPIGSAFFDVAGNMYGYSNGATGTANSGGFYSINVSTGAYTLISNIDPASVSDGASCINPGSSIDVTKEVTNVKAINAYTYDVSYSVRVRNTYTATLDNVQVTDLLKGNTAGGTNTPYASAQSVALAPNTTVTVTNYDGAGLVANPNFNGQSTASTGSLSGGALLDGTQSLTPMQRALITFTVRVTYANAGSVPTTARNNTAYATSTSSSPDKGYTLTSGDVLLSPNNLVTNDASTNSGEFPALRPADANNNSVAQDSPSPTPVSFTPSINGTVFEDVNYGGGAGRNQSTSQGVGRSGARVELYTVSNGTATYNSATTTAADGSYSFTTLASGAALTAGSSYVVRVVNNTVTSSRNTGNASGLLAVQTFRTSVNGDNGTLDDPSRVGGEYPARTDAGNGGSGTTIAGLTAGTAAAESISNITLSGNNAPAVNVDFGYNFDTVVNTNDSGQGSLRQFITNANALPNSTTSNGKTTYLINQDAASSSGSTKPAAGVETSIFMIPDGNLHDGLLAYNSSTSPGTASQLQGAANSVGGTVAAITPASALPALTDTYTTIDGTTQTQNVGNTNNTTLGTGGTVGTGTASTAAVALGQLNGPEVQLTGSTNVAIGLDVSSTATNTIIKGLAVLDFGNATDNDNNANIRSAANNVTITQNVLGTTATSFAAPGTLTNADNVRLTGGTSGVVVSSNLIGYANGKGIAIDGGVTNVQVTGNEIRSNGQSGANLDGIDIQGSSATITNNLLTGTSGQGIDSYRSSGGNAITGNTITDNGRGTSNLAPNETPGVRIYGAGNSLQQNVIANNYGAGIMLEATQTNGNGTAVSTTVMSQNSIYGNGTVLGRNGTAAATGDIGIDLQKTNDSEAAGASPYVTTNNSSGTAGANGLVNYPVLTTAVVRGGNLIVSGYAKSGAKIELFVAQPNAASLNATGAYFGQGKTYLTTVNEGNTNTANGLVDNDSRTGLSYSGSINGVDQGSDTNANGFSFSIPLSSLPSGVLLSNGALAAGTVLTSTATLNNATSEFSGNVTVPVGDVTVDLNGPTTTYAGQPTGTYTATFTNEGPQDATNVARVITLPTGATVTSAQVSALNLGGATVGTNSNGNVTLTYNPLSTLAAYASSTVQFAFTAPSTVSTGLTLTANTTADSQGANAAPDQATLTLSTLADADATAAITASATATTGTFVATFGNNGPQPAAGYTPTVQLPAGLTGVTVSSGWSYNSSTGLVSYGTTGSSLNSGSNLSVTISYPLSSAPSLPVTAVASVTTTTNELGRTANNTAQAVMTSAFDLTTTLTGPTSAVAGSPTTLYVTTTNNGPNLAPSASQTVTIPSSASLAGSIYITNGGTYSYSNGTGTVTFPTLTNVPTGQTVTNSITFLAPSASFVPTAAVAVVTGETNTNNNSANLNGGASGNAVSISTSTVTENEATTITATVNGSPATVVAPNSTVTYTVTSTNKGGAGATASDPKYTATVTEKVQLLPGLNSTNLKVGGVTGTTSNGSTLLSFASAGGTSSYDPATGILTYYSVTQAPGAATTTYDAITLTVPTAVGNDGQLTATASVSTNLFDNVPADNVATAGVRVATVPDVTTTITGPTSTAAGQPASYVVNFVNNGTASAYGVNETVQLPANLSGVSVFDASGNALSNVYNSLSGLVTLPTQSVLAAGSEQPYTIVLTAPAQTYPVSSAIISNTADGVATNNTANLTTTVTPNADLAVSISGPSVATVGNMVTYTLNTTNNGPSVASNVVPKLTLPTGLTLVGSQNGITTTNNGDGTTTYTFATVGVIAPGGNVGNFLNFAMTNPASGLINGLASVSSATTDLVASNNTAGITTSIAPTTTTQADLRTSISLAKINGTANSTNPATVAAGASLTYDVAFRNAGNGAGTGNAAQNVVPTATLPAGLSVSTLKLGNSTNQITGTQSGNIITFYTSTNDYGINGSTYNVSTGLLTLPTIASAAAQTSANADYFVNFPAPAGSSQLTLTSEVSSSTSDNFTATNADGSTVQSNTNNFSYVLTNITATYDVTTALSGAATAQPGATASYTVTTLNGGPSTASSSTTQNVTGLPTNLTTANLQVDGLTGTLSNGVITFSNGTTYTQSNGTLTLPAIAALPAGVANEVVHSFSFPMPATGNVNLTATVASANETASSLTNTAGLTTTPANIAPVAQNVWNSLQSPRGNTATNLPISPLYATDPDGSIASSNGYTITSLPTSGTLYYNGTAIAAANYQLTDPSKLSYKPAAGYAGDATFTYTATDNGSTALTSPPAIYTIMVAPDQSTTYTATPAKGNTNPYVTNDVLAYVVDANTDTYNSSGLIYGTNGGTTAAGNNSLLQSGAANGLPTSGTNAVLAPSGSGPSGNTNNTLPTGVALDAATGLIYVSNASQLPRVTTETTYSVNVITTDINGGTNTVLATFKLGALPLPVQLVAFTAQAVQNRDALLKWTTASELRNDHFELERSLDGTTFTKVGQVAGQGSKASATDYAFTDAGIGAKVSGAVYYRLKQVDQDGTATYSAVRTVSFTGSAAALVTLYPNPAQFATGLDLSALPAGNTYSVTLLDATGRLVRQATLAGGQVQSLPLSDVASGTYQVLVAGQQANGSTLRQVLRLIKE